MLQQLAFPSTDLTEELLLTELDDSFIGRASSREAAEVICSMIQLQCHGLSQFIRHTTTILSPLLSNLQQKIFSSQSRMTLLGKQLRQIQQRTFHSQALLSPECPSWMKLNQSKQNWYTTRSVYERRNIPTCPFTDPVEYTLLTELDGSICSRASFRDVFESVCSMQMIRWNLPLGFTIQRDCILEAPFHLQIQQKISHLQSQII